MARFFFFSLLLIVFASCQSEKSKNGDNSGPPAQLAANQPEAGQEEATASLEEQAVAPADTMEKDHPPGKKKVEEKSTIPPKKAPSKTSAKQTTRQETEAKPVEKAPSPQSSPIEEPKDQPEEEAAPPSHKQWDALLQKHVSGSGKVDYQGFVADKASLQAYLDELAAKPVEESWSRNEKLAYWINAYNAFTVKLIVDNYPTSSITNLHGGKPWDVKWIALGDKNYSLNQIENDIIRPRFKEPRIHFAVNCAAVSCPPLLNKAWTADKLNSYLSQQARSFINNPKYNEITPDKVMISRIFDWYAKDFGNIINYLNKYSETKVDPDAKVTYMEYDWALNGQ